MTRRLYIGDLQGCRQELEDLLEAVRFDPAHDRLHFVGDLINRGPDSAGCVRLVRELGAVTVLGNHELHLLEVVAGRRQPGGRDTLASLLEAADADELIGWLQARPVLHLEPDIVLVHAGLRPGWSDLESLEPLLRRDVEQVVLTGALTEDLEFALTARRCSADGMLLRKQENAQAEFERADQPWDAFYRGPRIAVFGHWAQRGLVVGEWVRGLDTGCVYGKQLSAWIAEEDRIVQVPARKAWCPI